MGRPKKHGDATRRALLEAAEAALQTDGAEGLSMRTLAKAAGTTTRAVYSLVGGREGLYGALYRESFRALSGHLDRQPLTTDPQGDLRRLATEGFRGYALSRPNLFRLAFERLVPGLNPSPEDQAAGMEALQRLQLRIRRVGEAGQLGGRKNMLQVALQFHAICQGLASAELAGWLGPKAKAAAVWDDTVYAFLRGLQTPPAPRGPSR